MASSEVSINQLPVASEANNGDFLIIQTPNATNRLDFQNFVVGLDNTTFKSTIENHTTDITNLSTTQLALSTEIDAISAISTDLTGLSANVRDIVTSGLSNFTELSAKSLSAGSFEFPRSIFPANAQVIYKTHTTRVGSGNTALDIDLKTSISLKHSNSKIKVHFSVPGTTNAGNHTVALIVQESVTDASYADVADFQGTASGSEMVGTIFTGTDANEEGVTASFTGLFTPASLGADNTVFVRIAMRMESGNQFNQNQTIIAGTQDACGVSLLLLEEVFVQ